MNSVHHQRFVEPSPGLAMAYGGSHARTAIFDQAGVHELMIDERPVNTADMIGHIAGQIIDSHSGHDLKSTVIGLPFPVKRIDDDWNIGPAGKEGPFHDEVGGVLLKQALITAEPSCEQWVDNPKRPLIVENDCVLLTHAATGLFGKKPLHTVSSITLGTGVGNDALYYDAGLYRRNPAWFNEIGLSSIPWDKKDNAALQQLPALEEPWMEGGSQSVQAEAALSGPAVARMAGVEVEDIALIPDDHPIWKIYGKLLHILIMNTVMIQPTSAMFIGGGVAAHRRQVIGAELRSHRDSINGWARQRHPRLRVVTPRLADTIELLGARSAALDALNPSQTNF